MLGLVLLIIPVVADLFSRCDIERVGLTLGQLDVLDALPDRPVVYSLDDPVYKNRDLERLTSRLYLLENHYSNAVIVSSSNAYSHDKSRTTLGEYIHSFDEAVAVSASSKANETFYLFGDNYGGIWKRMSASYEVASCRHCNKAGAKSCGLGGRNSGVSFHLHGPGFAEVLHGSKLWVLFAPQVGITDIPRFNPNVSMAEWVKVYESELALDSSRAPVEFDAESEPAFLPDSKVNFLGVSDALSAMQSCVLRPGR